MISASLGANLTAVKLRQVPASFFQIQPDLPPLRPTDAVQVLRPTLAPVGAQQPASFGLNGLGTIHLVPPTPDMPFSGLPGDPITAAGPDVPATLVTPDVGPALVTPAAAPPIIVVPPAPIERRPLGDEQTY
jgi:hypothetical protein